MNEAESGWLAGIIDGEGCITISIQKPGSGGRVSPSHRLYIAARQSCFERIRDLKPSARFRKQAV